VGPILSVRGFSNTLLCYVQHGAGVHRNAISFAFFNEVEVGETYLAVSMYRSRLRLRSRN
jgi:hypothetical protein